MSCWKSGDNFLTQKLLKNHISAIHGGLSVICPFCQKFEQKFKRVSDLKVHARKYHHSLVEKLPAETFSENNGFWCSIHPDDYRQLIKPSARSSEPAIQMRTLVLDWAKAMGARASRSREDFLQGWEEPETFTLTLTLEDEGFDYFDLEDETTLECINLVPGSIFVDLKKGADQFRLILSDHIFKDTNSIRSLTRRMGSLPIPSSPFSFLDPQEDTQPQHKTHLSKFLGISDHLVEKLLRKQVAIKRVLESSETDSTPKKPRSGFPNDISPRPAQCPPEVASSAHKVQVTHIVSHTPVPEPVSIISSMSSNISAQPNHQKPCYEPLPAGPTLDYRATKLLKMGGMPQWQPARRAWDQEEEVSFVEKELTIFWPPKGWRDLSPQQKLMQWEFAALSILKARGENYIHIQQGDLLDAFNFLALPGTAAHKVNKSVPSYLTIKSRFFNYSTLRAIAVGELKDEKWLTMLEAGAMMRDTANDKLLKMCSMIKLRLTKD